MSAAMIAMWVTIVKRFAVGELPLNHYLCAGIDPNQMQGPGYYQCMPKKYNASLITVIVCFILHIPLVAKIFWFQKQEEKRVEPIELGSFAVGHPDIPQMPHRKKSESPRTLRYVLVVTWNFVSCLLISQQ